MTEHDIVAESWSAAEKRAAIAISEQLNVGEWRSLVLARAALEASHHAELVGELIQARMYISSVVPSRARTLRLQNIAMLLAKIGGEA